MTQRQRQILIYTGAFFGVVLLITLIISAFTGGGEGTGTTTPEVPGLFPGGGTSVTEIPRIGAEGEVPGQLEGEEELEPVVEIVFGEPIVAYAVIEKTGTSTIATGTPKAPTVRFIERETGNVYEIDMDWQKRNESLTRLTNVTIPGIQRGYFSSNGNAALIQYLDEEGATRSAILAFPQNDPADMRIQFVEGDFSDITLSPDGTQAFLLEYGDVGTADGIRGSIMSIPGGVRREVFTSPLTSLSTTWRGSRIYVYERPGSEGYGGALYRINPQTGASVRVFASQNPFSAHGGANFVLTDEGGTITRFADTSQVGESLPISTFAEKCAGLQGSLFCAVPDFLPGRESWYTGEVSSNDGIVVLDSFGSLQEVYAANTAGATHDFTDPRMSARHDFFTLERGTGLLWRFTIPASAQ